MLWFGQDGFASFVHLLSWVESLSLPPLLLLLFLLTRLLPRLFPEQRRAGPNRKQIPVAHVCTLKRWREIKGMWQVLCLIYNIISNISMNQTTHPKQRLMMQTHKTHAGWEWEVKMALKRNAAKPLDVDSFPQAQAAGQTFQLLLPDPSFHLPGGCCVTPRKIVFQHIYQQRSLADEFLCISQPLCCRAFWEGIIDHDHKCHNLLSFCLAAFCSLMFSAQPPLE